MNATWMYFLVFILRCSWEIYQNAWRETNRPGLEIAAWLRKIHQAKVSNHSLPGNIYKQKYFRVRNSMKFLIFRQTESRNIETLRMVRSVDEGFGLPWSLGRYVVAWPVTTPIHISNYIACTESINAVKSSDTKMYGGRPVEYTSELKARRVLSFPSCVETPQGQWRYLGTPKTYFLSVSKSYTVPTEKLFTSLFWSRTCLPIQRIR